MKSSEITSSRSSKSSKKILADEKPSMTDRLGIKVTTTKATSKVQKIALRRVLAARKIESAPNWNGKRVLSRASSGKVGASVAKYCLLKSGVQSCGGSKIKSRRRKTNPGSMVKNFPKVSVPNSDQASTLRHKIKELKGIIINKADKTASETLISNEQSFNDKSEDKENVQDKIELWHETKGQFSNASEMMRNAVIPEKSYHKKKRCKSYRNDHVETCQSRAVTDVRSKSILKSSPQSSQTTKHADVEQDEAVKKRFNCENCTIICTPDIIIDRYLDNEDAEESEQPVPTWIDEKTNDEFHTIKDQHAVDTLKDSPSPKVSVCEKNFTESKSLKNLKDDVSCLKSVNPCHEAQKKGDQEAGRDSLKGKSTHVNAQTMPVYTSKIAVAKNDYGKEKTSTEIKSPSWTECKDDNLGDRYSKNTVTKEQSPLPVTQATPNLPSNTCPVNEKVKITAPPCKYYITINSDSDDTLSNIESVPNSPGQENWQSSAKRYSSLTNNHQKHNYPRSKSPKRDRSPVACEISGCVENTESTEGDENNKLETRSINKRQRIEIDDTSICSNKETEPRPQYHTEAPSTGSTVILAEGSEKSTADIRHNKTYESPQEVSWLRHYERPRATYLSSAKNNAKFEDNGKENLRKHQSLSCAQEKHDETIKKPTTNVTVPTDDPAQPNSRAEGYSLRDRQEKQPRPVIQKLGKRGRPRKQDSQKSGPSTETKKKSQRKTSDLRNSGQTSAAVGDEPGVSNSTNGPSANGLTLNGHALSFWELQTLFLKFLQHGHFRVDPDQPPIVTLNNDENFAAGMHCYDPKGYRTQPCNTNVTSNSESQKNPHSPRRFSTNNDGRRYDSMNNGWPNDTNHWNCNSELYTNPISDYMQSQRSLPSYYHQNLYNNNANFMGNDINSDHGYANSNNLMNNASNFPPTTSNFNSNINFNQNIQRQFENSANSQEIDLSMINRNTMPNNSMNPMPNISANNLSPSWGSDNTNGVATNANSMNCLNELNQTLEGSTSLNNFMHSQNSPNSVTDSWMNRTNNMFNINRRSTFPPWQGSFPMYSSYLNNADSYYRNIFNPCNTLMALDLQNYPYQYTMENNSNQWMQNITPGGTGNSTFNASSFQYPYMNYGSSEVNPMNQGVNLSLSGEAAVDTIDPETRFIDPGEANSEMDYRNASKRNSVESKNDGYRKLLSSVNNEMQKSAIGYSNPMCVPYSMGYKNDMENREIDDIDGANVVDDDIDMLEEQNLPQIQDYVNRTLDSFEGCFNQAYTASDSSNSRTVTDLSNNTETELTKLRQELADFTKQYSENQTSSTSSILHNDFYN